MKVYSTQKQYVYNVSLVKEYEGIINVCIKNKKGTDRKKDVSSLTFFFKET